jgi:fatty-acyl-CoA synthase
VLLENTPEYVFLIAGAALCGATVVGINPTRRGAELAADIRGTDCAVIVTDHAYGDLLDGVGHGVSQILDASSSG